MSTPQRTLGRYTLLRRLAAGGMGEIYLAEAQGAANFTKRVAIKRILPHLARNEDFVHKFIDEANLMVQLHHGNIVPVLELADDEGELYLVMEYLPGRDLKAVMRRIRSQERPMPPDLAIWLVSEISTGLDYAHRKVGADGRALNIVHRDVSPSNIVLGAGGEVKLVDFGIARARGGLHQSISGTLQGKFVYMSPEQADGRSVDPRSDVFSAGLVLYELLTGVRPFEGESETETLRRVREAKVAPPSTVLAGLPPALDALVMRALAADPDARYPSAAELRRALSRFLVETESHADAGALARYLGELFPEGVVPDSEPAGPVSMDDALMQQLGSLTPSADGFGRTRTATGDGPAQVERRRRTESVQSVPQRNLDSVTGNPSGPLSGVSPGAPVPPPATPASVRGTRRRLLLVATLAAAATAVWMQRPDKARLVVEAEPAEAQVAITRDGATLAADATLQAGDEIEACGEAEGYLRACRTRRLGSGDNRLVLRLEPRLALAPRVTPEGVPFRTTVDDGDVTLPFPLRRGETYTVCVVAEGHSATPPCRTLVAEVDTTGPLFALTPMALDAGPAPEADAGRTDAAAEPARPIRPAKRGEVVLSTHTVATVFRGGERVGVTPYPVTITGRPQHFELRLAGYAPTPVTVSSEDPPGKKTVTMLAFAKFTLRLEPGASKLFIDGNKVLLSSPFQDVAVPPGRHAFVARWADRDTNRVYESETLTLDFQPGESKKLDPLIVPIPEGAP